MLADGTYSQRIWTRNMTRALSTSSVVVEELVDGIGLILAEQLR